ncbi:MAG: response regulator [Lachnospiraceae bacterium]|nr:response regulator [Lachnospiraceae bacterium]
MKVLIVDDEISAIEILERRVRDVLGDSVIIFTATDGEEALRIVKKEQVDVMFLDVELPGMSGLEIAKQSKANYPRTNVILCTAYEQYALQAWELFISGYIVKPVSPEDIKKALDHLRTPVVEKLTVKCFGYFDVFFRDQAVKFKRRGAKEMLAYLVSVRGAGVTGGMLCEILHAEAIDPDLKKASVRKYAQEIRSSLSEIGFNDVLFHTRDNYSVNVSRLDCDYYRYLDGDRETRKLFNGEFMQQYSWAETTVGLLEAMRV